MWRVYYDDGYVIADATIPDTRRVGVIAVAVTDETHNWAFWYGKDWYILQNDGEWMGVDQAGMHDQVLTRLDQLTYVLQGRSVVPFNRYQDVIDQMQRDCQPPKTGWHPGEKA